jgi:hypothetical protein
MRYTLRERITLFRAAWTGSGRWVIPGPEYAGYGDYLMRRLCSAVGPVPTPTNSSSSGQPVTGNERERHGLDIPQEYPEVEDLQIWLLNNGYPLEDGYEGD